MKKLLAIVPLFFTLITSGCNLSTLSLTPKTVEVVQEINRIYLDLNNRDVTIKFDSNIKDSKVSYYDNEQDRISCNLENGILTIEEHTNLFNLNIKDSEDEIVITLPYVSVAEIDLSTDVGNLYIEHMDITHLNVDIDVCNFTITDSKVDQCNVDLDTGNVSISKTSFVSYDGEIDVGNLVMTESERERFNNTNVNLLTNIGNIIFFNEAKGKELKYLALNPLYSFSLDIDVGDITIS